MTLQFSRISVKTVTTKQPAGTAVQPALAGPLVTHKLPIKGTQQPCEVHIHNNWLSYSDGTAHHSVVVIA